MKKFNGLPYWIKAKIAQKLTAIVGEKNLIL